MNEGGREKEEVDDVIPTKESEGGPKGEKL